MNKELFWVYANGTDTRIAEVETLPPKDRPIIPLAIRANTNDDKSDLIAESFRALILDAMPKVKKHKCKIHMSTPESRLLDAIFGEPTRKCTAQWHYRHRRYCQARRRQKESTT